ncbi:MAG: hypothetical protein ABIH78_01415 [Candidatus Peregrinibacteria bacterium]
MNNPDRGQDNPENELNDPSVVDDIRRRIASIAMTMTFDERPDAATILAALPDDLAMEVSRRAEGVARSLVETDIPQAIYARRVWTLEQRKYMAALQTVLDQLVPGWDNGEWGDVRRYM